MNFIFRNTFGNVIVLTDKAAVAANKGETKLYSTHNKQHVISVLKKCIGREIIMGSSSGESIVLGCFLEDSAGDIVIKEAGTIHTVFGLRISSFPEYCNITRKSISIDTARILIGASDTANISWKGHAAVKPIQRRFNISIPVDNHAATPFRVGIHDTIIFVDTGKEFSDLKKTMSEAKINDIINRCRFDFISYKINPISSDGSTQIIEEV